MSESQTDDSTIIIGAGQSGLATGYYLQEYGCDFTILAADERVGDTWRDRWDSLELFTPAFYNDLPGMAFPADDPEQLPSKDEVADYLEAYADEFDLPVQLETTITGVQQDDDGFRLQTRNGTVKTENLVVATGAHQDPNIPPVADDVPETVFTTHSSGYTNPSQLQSGDVLVVGAGNSGTQIATDIATADQDRQVYLVGPDAGQVPRRVLGRDFYRWAAPTVLKLKRTGILGRHLYEKTAGHADPVFKPEVKAMEQAGVERVIGRITDVENGQPVTDAGDRFDVDNIIWCTGFDPDYSWIDIDVFQDNGYPRHTRGVVTETPGLYFVGLPWMYRKSSSLIGGVGRDAKHIATQIHNPIQTP